MSTQRELAAAALGKIVEAMSSFVGPTRSALSELRDVLDRAQNGPPEGEADGTIDEPMWTRLRDYARSVDAALHGFEAHGRGPRP